MTLCNTLRLKAYIISLMFASIPLLICGQDAQYWNFQFGSKSALLGGAVIGSVDDISAVFYNPGALGVIEDPSFTVSANVFEFSNISLVDDLGRGITLGTSNTGLRPSLVAGTLKRDLFGQKGILAYSALTRQSGSSDFQGLIVSENFDLFPNLDFEDFASNSRFDQRFNDVWVGLTYAQPLGERFGIGVTWFNALRSQRQRTETILQGVNDGLGDAETSISIQGGDYYAARMIFKFGANYRTDKLSAGLTVTTGGLHILGKGQLFFNESFISPDSSALAATSQEDLKARYNSPLSVGGGLAYRFGQLHAHFSAEWFSSVSQYEVMRGANWESQQPAGDSRELVSIQEQRDVLNWGVGLEYEVKESLRTSISYFIDNSVRPEIGTRADLTVSPININNLNIGTDFQVGRVKLDVGLGYSWGKEPDEQLTELIRGADGDIEVSYLYRSFRLLFGIEIDRK